MSVCLRHLLISIKNYLVENGVACAVALRDLDMKLLLAMRFEKIFSQSVACVFYLLTG